MPQVSMLSNHDYGLLRCEGPDAQRFLQGQISTDMTLIQGHQGGMACDLNLKGRIIAAFYLYAEEQGYNMIVPRDQMIHLLADLKKYAVFSKVQLRDLSDEYTVSPQLSSDPQPGIFRYQLLSEAKGQRLMITDRGSFLISKETAQSSPMGAWYAHLIEHDIPTITAAERELFLPHYIGLLELGAISFDKGCYKGQEIVARMHYRGKLKKKVFHQVLAGEHIFKSGEQYEEGEVVNCILYQGQTYMLLSSPHPQSY